MRSPVYIGEDDVSHSRRQFIRAISLGILATHVTASAQESRRMPRLARLFPLGVSATAHTENAFRQGLRELGWVEGGWWWCASERGGGLACWLEIMRATRGARPVRDVLFVASSGHELGHLGLDDAFIERRPGLVSAAKAWIHPGANIGAARGPGNTLQASDDEMESMMTEVMTKAGLPIDRRRPRAAVPLGEAENVHRGGGRYISIIGNNELFHNTSDRGADVIDLRVIERFAGAFAMVTTSLASA